VTLARHDFPTSSVKLTSKPARSVHHFPSAGRAGPFVQDVSGVACQLARRGSLDES